MSKIVTFAMNTGKKAIEAGKPVLAKAWYYARVELVPPKPSEIGEIKNGFVRLINGFRRGTWKEVSVKQAWLNTLIATEIGCWFFIGECIGKGSLIGYDV